MVVLAVLGLDQLTKLLVLRHLGLGEFIPMGFFDIRHVHNYGAAFGMMQHFGLFFVAIAVVVLLALVFNWSRIRTAGLLVTMALALIAGGTIGNLVDRLRFGYVVDFIDLRWWPVFNVADSSICIGVGLLVWKILQHHPPEPTVHSEPNQTSAPTT